MAYFNSLIGRKQLMAVTGLAWSGFVLSHMLGNLLIFVGPEAYNKYGHAIVTNPLIYVAEAGLLLTLALHIFEGVALTARNRFARPQKYAMPTNGEKAARFQSKWMAFHGSLILVFVVLHLVTFKYGPGVAQGYKMTVDGHEIRDLHRLMVEVFRQPGYVVWYVICLIGVGLHLSHGFYSSFASLGLYHPRYAPWVNRFGHLYAAVVALGFISQPIYVYFFAP